MAHAHPKLHHHGRLQSSQRRLTITLVLAAAYMIAEAVAGFLANSLALLADAGHMLSDVAALGLSVFAMWIARRPPTSTHTYGYYRAEILAALLNGATLIAIAIYIFAEAYQRLQEPPTVLGPVVTGVAIGGLAINLIGLWILGGIRFESLNVQGAWLHVLTDALGSVGAIAAGSLVWAWGWNWADPLISVLIGLLVIYSSWRLLAETVAVLMESAPRGIDVDAVRDELVALRGVVAVHDLHVWTITSGLHSMSAHVITDGNRSHRNLLREIHNLLHDQFGIEHVTIQLEDEEFSQRERHISI